MPYPPEGDCGSFSVLIQKNLNYKTSWRVKIIFSIGLHKKDLSLLEAIQSTFKVGKIHKHGPDSFQFRVDSIEELQVIIDHFLVYPLQSAKRSTREGGSPPLEGDLIFYCFKSVLI